MRIVIALLWALILILSMLWASKFFVPCLVKKNSAAEAGAPPSPAAEGTEKAQDLSPAKVKGILNKKTEITESGFLHKHRTAFIVIMIVSAVFIGVSGYFGAKVLSNPVNVAKVTLAVAVLGVAFVTDLSLMIIPNSLALVLMGGRLVTVLLEFIFYPDTLLPQLINSVITIVVTLCSLLILSLITRGGIGMGDVKIFSALGFLLGGRAVLSVLLLSLIAGAICSTILLITKKKGLRDLLPLGTFIIYGLGLAVIFSLI